MSDAKDDYRPSIKPMSPSEASKATDDYTCGVHNQDWSKDDAMKVDLGGLMKKGK